MLLLMERCLLGLVMKRHSARSDRISSAWMSVLVPIRRVRSSWMDCVPDGKDWIKRTHWLLLATEKKNRPGYIHFPCICSAYDWLVEISIDFAERQCVFWKRIAAFTTIWRWFGQLLRPISQDHVQFPTGVFFFPWKLCQWDPCCGRCSESSSRNRFIYIFWWMITGRSCETYPSNFKTRFIRGKSREKVSSCQTFKCWQTRPHFIFFDDSNVQKNCWWKEMLQPTDWRSITSWSTGRWTW